ncbi:PASTA domain-containing protein [Microbacterium sp.]|uniref:PASTA domain-containing protein n=1 Tax=Microbacterium sp. TaxID=51671 RepID=UPI0039E43EC1
MRVTVPDLVGQPVDIAQEVAAGLGLSLASGDPDGPGLRSRTWPGLFLVETQDRIPGSEVDRGTQIGITFVQYGEGDDDVDRVRTPA